MLFILISTLTENVSLCSVMFQGDPAQWQIIFYVAAGVYLFGAVIYGIFASGNRQKWAEVATGYMSYRDGVETEQDEN